MLFEILSTGTMMGVMGTSYYFKTNASKDHEKIEKIAKELNLSTKEEQIRLYRKHKSPNCTEYVYKIPLGLSYNHFTDKKDVFVDGLNNKSKPELDWRMLKEINWKEDLLPQFKRILNHRKKLNRELEIEYDGMLKFRVYDEGLLTRYDLNKQIISKLPKWHVAVGKTLDGQITHNFEKGAHILLGGATDMGKSTILNNIITTLTHNHPDDVEFTLIDLKGGIELGQYENMKQVKHFADDVNSAAVALNHVGAKMARIFNQLRENGQKDIRETNIKKRHFLIIDEAAELTSHDETDKEVKATKIHCENMLKDIARRGRASGIRIIYATQNPTREAVSTQVKRNLITRICLPVDTSIASQVVLDEGGGEKLPIEQGRAIYKRHKCQTMQSYYVPKKLTKEVIAPYVEVRKREIEPKARENITLFEEA